MSMGKKELAAFLEGAERQCPWSDAFEKLCCNACEPEQATIIETREKIELYPCDCEPHECPYGNSVEWWLKQETEEKEN